MAAPSNFSPTTPNPTLGGYPGAFLFEDARHCNCNFAKNYPFALGPESASRIRLTQRPYSAPALASSTTKPAPLSSAIRQPACGNFNASVLPGRALPR